MCIDDKYWWWWCGFTTSKESGGSSFVNTSDSALAVELLGAVHWSGVFLSPAVCLDLQQTLDPLPGRHYRRRQNSCHAAGVEELEFAAAPINTQFLLIAEWHVLTCTDMYRHVLACTDMYWHEDGARGIYLNSSVSFLCCNFLPIPKPRKQRAYIGVTPMIGAAMPLYRPSTPYKHLHCL